MTFQDIIARLRLQIQDDKELRRSLRQIMGFYPRNIEHYKIALTHKSSGQRNDKGKPLNNERLEFLGDAMLDAVVGHIVFDRFKGKREGFLTNTRSKLVSRDSLGKLAHEMGLEELIQSKGQQQRSHNSYMAGNAFEALVGAIYLDQGYDAVRRFMEKRILKQMVIDKVAYKEVNFKSKLIEWTQKNRVHMEYRMLKQTMDDKGSPIFGFQVFIEGVEGGKAQGYSKKEAQQLASKETLERLRREPQFIDSIFAAKSERTKMEEEPTMAAPNIEEIEISEAPLASENPEFPLVSEAPKTSEAREAPSSPPDDEFDLSDITHNPKELSREEIIAAAEEAAFAES